MFKVYEIDDREDAISDAIETIAQLMNFIESWEKAWGCTLQLLYIESDKIYVRQTDE